MRFFAVKREADVVDPTTGQVLLPGEKRVEGTLELEFPARVDELRIELQTDNPSQPTVTMPLAATSVGDWVRPYCS